MITIAIINESTVLSDDLASGGVLDAIQDYSPDLLLRAVEANES